MLGTVESLQRWQWVAPGIIPAPGAKNRETKSNRGSSERAVTMVPRTSTAPSARKSGTSARSSASLATSRSRSKRLRPVHVGLAPIASARPDGAGEGCGGREGKSSSIQPSRHVAPSGPLSVR